MIPKKYSSQIQTAKPPRLVSYQFPGYYAIVGNFGEVFNLANSVKITKLLANLGAKNSDRQTQISPIPTESRFTKFNVCQSYLLYYGIPLNAVSIVSIV